MSNIIDGKAVSATLVARVAEEVARFKEKCGRAPGLAVIQVGENPSSTIYVNNKDKKCKEIGMLSTVIRLPETASQDELLAQINALNEDKTCDGILVQLPLPAHIDEQAVITAIAPDKDVDGFHILNAGKLFTGERSMLPCTPKGIMELIKSTGKDITGAHAVVIGRSNIVGKPIAMLLLNANCTVTVCHSRTKDLKSITSQADILVAAIGKKEFVDASMVKPGAIVIDVGINRVDGKVYGDVNFDEVSKVAEWITPVPGGVGPMTIAELMANTVEAAWLHE